MVVSGGLEVRATRTVRRTVKRFGHQLVLAAVCLCPLACGPAGQTNRATPVASGGIPKWAKVSAEQVAAARRLGVPVALENHIGMRLVLIPAGRFRMGSPAGEKGRTADEVLHTVRLTRPVYAGIHEVTQTQYEALTGKDPSYHKGPDRPVEQVSWNDAMAFCKKLSETEGRRYSLATESQWEYACRSGTRTAYYFGDDAGKLGDYAWYSANSNGGHHPVGRKKPNAWGLYDLYGNVFEWCLDRRAPYGDDPRTDPLVEKGTERVCRGGSWTHHARHCRSAFRYHDGATHRHDIIGFRVVLLPGE